MRCNSLHLCCHVTLVTEFLKFRTTAECSAAGSRRQGVRFRKLAACPDPMPRGKDPLYAGMGPGRACAQQLDSRTETQSRLLSVGWKIAVCKVQSATLGAHTCRENAGTASSSRRVRVSTYSSNLDSQKPETCVLRIGAFSLTSVHARWTRPGAARSACSGL